MIHYGFDHMPINIIITGSPRSGKSTLALSLITELRLNKKWVAGVLTPEIIKNKERTGFRIIDIASDETKVLASIDGKGPRVGKYFVNMEELNYIVDKFLSHIESADVIIIDEIGKMEMLSEKFRNMVEKVFSMKKPVIAVVSHDMIGEYTGKGDVYTIGEKDNIEKIKAKILKDLRIEY
jgi:nucleoside-triphosphatase